MKVDEQDWAIPPYDKEQDTEELREAVKALHDEADRVLEKMIEEACDKTRAEERALLECGHPRACLKDRLIPEPGTEYCLACKQLEEEREACAGLDLPLEPNMMDRWKRGFDAGVRAFRTAIRARSGEGK